MIKSGFRPYSNVPTQRAFFSFKLILVLFSSEPVYLKGRDLRQAYLHNQRSVLFACAKCILPVDDIIHIFPSMQHWGVAELGTILSAE